MELDGGQQYYLKPMNCPFHILIFRSRQRSYRELPMRLFEFGTVYRYEKSGVIHGLTRVRGHDPGRRTHLLHPPADGRRAHVALDVRPRPVARLRPRRLLSRAVDPAPARPSASDEDWEEATEALRRWPSSMSLEPVLDEGGGAFYGPKISVQARDAIGRTWQMSTIQLDFQLPAALRPRVHRRRQRPPPPDHDPPGAVRFGRALLRGARRALRRCLPDVALAGASQGAARPRRPRGVLRPCREHARCRRHPGRQRLGRRAPEGAHPPGEAQEAAIRARRRWRRRRCGYGRRERPGRRRPSAVCPWPSSSRARWPRPPSRSGARRRDPQPLWAGWRAEYVGLTDPVADDGAPLGAPAGAAEVGERCVFCAICASDAPDEDDASSGRTA